MSGGDDWQAGDLALCVNAARNPTLISCTPLRQGAIYTVEAIHPGVVDHAFFGRDYGLYLTGIHSASSSGAFASQRFRKIRPHTPDAEDAETIALLNGKPATVPA